MSLARKGAPERAWPERKARERGRIALPGLRREMDRADVGSRLLEREVEASRTTILRIARGESWASRELAEAIAEALNTTVEELTKP